MMCVLPLLSGGISSWRQGRGNPLRHTTTHTDTRVSLDSPSSSLQHHHLHLHASWPPPPTPLLNPPLPRLGRLSSALSLVFISPSVSSSISLLSASLLLLFIKPLRLKFTNSIQSQLSSSKTYLLLYMSYVYKLSSDPMINPMYALNPGAIQRHSSRIYMITQCYMFTNSGSLA